MIDPAAIFRFPAFENYDSDGASEAFSKHPEIYTNHVAIAALLDLWAERLRPTIHSSVEEEDWCDEHKESLLDMAGRLRNGDFIPGSPEFDELEGKCG